MVAMRWGMGRWASLAGGLLTLVLGGCAEPGRGLLMPVADVSGVTAKHRADLSAALGEAVFPAVAGHRLIPVERERGAPTPEAILNAVAIP